MKNKIGLICLFTLSMVACGKSANDGSSNGSNTSTDANTSSATNSNTSSNTNPQLRFLGRVVPDNSGHALLSWPGAAVQASTHATQLSVNLSLVASLTNAQAGAVQIFIDGTPQATRTQLSPTQTSYNIAGLDGNQHVVTIVKATEAADGDIEFGGFNGSLDANGPTAPTRSIEFIGDSVTVGFDIEGPAGNPNACPGDNYPYASDPNLTNTSKNYAFLTAQGFQADWTMIAYSGRGVYRNRDGTFNGTAEPTVAGMWPWTNCNMPGTNWSFQKAPDLVVVNLGTNDFASSGSDTTTETLPDETGFVNTYSAFLQAINSKYPNAPIVVTIGPMLSDNQTLGGKPQLTTAKAYIQEAVKASGLKNISFFAYTPNSGQWTCDYHPDEPEAQIMAQQLMAFIRANVSGWN